MIFEREVSFFGAFCFGKKSIEGVLNYDLYAE